MITENTVASDEVEIAAPAELVWQILVDFDNYGKWNGFCPKVVNRGLKVGEAVEMTIDLGFGMQEQCEYITEVVPQKVIAWGMENKPGDPIHAVRSQKITSLGTDRCSYISVDIFSGSALASMMELMAKPVETGFNKCAYDLKRYAETVYRQRNG